MNNEKPKDVLEYRKWLEDKIGIEISEKIQRHYESVADKIKKNFEESKFWIQLSENLKTYDSEYFLEKQYPLFALIDKPKLLIKPFSSFFLKTFRKNIINNENWPKEPKDGWILPYNWFSKINDIVRTYLVVKCTSSNNSDTRPDFVSDSFALSL